MKPELKKAISEWKISILKKYPHEKGSAKEIAKKNYQVNYKFN